MSEEKTVKMYDFDVMEMVKEGWARSASVRPLFFAAFALYLAAGAALQFVLGMIFPSTEADPNLVNEIIVTLVGFPVLVPLFVGIMMTALRHVRKEAVAFGDIFAYYGKTGELALAALVVYIMTMFGFILLVIPGIYLSVAYIFTMMLIVDKGMGIWDAMELSRKAITQHWFKVFFLLLVLAIALLAGFLTLGIGLFWTAPLAMVTLYGLLYTVIFD